MTDRRRVRIDHHDCNSCSVCTDTAPDHFALGDDGLAHVLAQPTTPEAWAGVQVAVDNCPTEVILVEDGPADGSAG